MQLDEEAPDLHVLSQTADRTVMNQALGVAINRLVIRFALT